MYHHFTMNHTLIILHIYIYFIVHPISYTHTIASSMCKMLLVCIEMLGVTLRTTATLQSTLSPLWWNKLHQQCCWSMIRWGTSRAKRKRATPRLELPDLPSPKLTWHLRMDGWNTFSFHFGMAYFQGRTDSFRECTLQESVFVVIAGWWKIHSFYQKSYWNFHCHWCCFPWELMKFHHFKYLKSIHGTQ